MFLGSELPVSSSVYLILLSLGVCRIKPLCLGTPAWMPFCPGVPLSSSICAILQSRGIYLIKSLFLGRPAVVLPSFATSIFQMHWNTRRDVSVLIFCETIPRCKALLFFIFLCLNRWLNHRLRIWLVCVLNPARKPWPTLHKRSQKIRSDLQSSLESCFQETSPRSADIFSKKVGIPLPSIFLANFRQNEPFSLKINLLPVVWPNHLTTPYSSAVQPWP